MVMQLIRRSTCTLPTVRIGDLVVYQVAPSRAHCGSVLAVRDGMLAVSLYADDMFTPLYELVRISEVSSVSRPPADQ